MASKNEPGKTDELTDKLRGAIEHRATWMYLLMDEAKKRGLDWYDFARAAILRCGRLHGDIKFHHERDLEKFSKAFANEDAIKIFAMDVKEASKDRLHIEFHYCPLLAAWKKAGATDAECRDLCEIAMDGDRGIVASCPGLEFTLGDTIANGGNVCQITVSRK